MTQHTNERATENRMFEPKHARLRDLWDAKREAVKKAQDKLDAEQNELEMLEEDVRAAYHLERAQESLEQMERELSLAGVPIPPGPVPRCSETADMFGGGR